MKKYIILFFVIFCVSFNAQSQINKIENVQTSKHIELPGTKYLLIKPDSSFTVSTDFTGLSNKDLEAGINITELPMSFDAVLPMFTKDLPPKDGELVFERDLVMNGYQAKMYKTDVIQKSALEELTNPEKEGKAVTFWLLLYGNENFCLTIAATYPSSLDKELSDKFERSLRSFLYLEEKEVNPLDGLTFGIDLKDTPLKFATTVFQTGAAFNIDGKFPTESDDITSYSIMIMPFGIESMEQKEAAIKKVRKPFEEIDIKEVNPITLDSLKGYEVVGYGNDENGELTLNYSVTLFDTERHFIINGVSKIEIEEKLEMFRKISSTFRLN